MELTYEILEYEPYAPALARFNGQKKERDRSDCTYGSGASSVILSKLAVMTSGLSGY